MRSAQRLHDYVLVVNFHNFALMNKNMVIFILIDIISNELLL